MPRKSRKLTTIQIVTLIAIVAYILWEKNMREYMQTYPDIKVFKRRDLYVIIPVLVILIAISIFQFVKQRSRNS